MIFVTVGSMFPFNRIIEVMDGWAQRHPEEKVFAQIGNGSYLPAHMQYERMVSPGIFRKLNEEADIIVAHAGMGSVITASELGKPIVLLPRLAALKEHTTDHQLHTARWLKGRSGIYVAEENGDLDAQIDAARLAKSYERLTKFAPKAFTDQIRLLLNH